MTFPVLYSNSLTRRAHRGEPLAHPSSPSTQKLQSSYDIQPQVYYCVLLKQFAMYLAIICFPHLLVCPALQNLSKVRTTAPRSSRAQQISTLSLIFVLCSMFCFFSPLLQAYSSIYCSNDPSNTPSAPSYPSHAQESTTCSQTPCQFFTRNHRLFSILAKLAKQYI